MKYLTEDLVSAVKRNALVPTGQTTFTDPDDFISFANEQLQTKLAPTILSARQDFFLANRYSTIVANVDHYPIPERAIGNALKDVFYVPDVTNPSVRYPLPPIQVHDSYRYGSTSGSAPVGFGLEGDEVVIYPKPTTATGSLQFYYFQRPSDLVSTSSCAKITAISSVGGVTTFTVDTDLTASLSVGSIVDFLSTKSPFLLWSTDVAITAITATTIAVTQTAVEGQDGAVAPIVGDYICPAQKANIPMVPQEFHPILGNMVAAMVMKALGAIQNLQMVNQDIADSLKSAFDLIANRVESEPDVIYDSKGILSNSGFVTHGFLSK